MITNQPQINSARLKNLLDGINKFGHNQKTGGYNRIGFSDADQAVRNWFRDQMKADGLIVKSDAAGNLFGRLGEQDAPCVMIGSHLDTVPEGGAFDGALGAAIALECARCLKDNGARLQIPLVVAATSEEEGRFGGMLGSQAISGQIDPSWVDIARDAEDILLSKAMQAQGYNPAELPAAAWPKDSIRAFLELHIEQGPILESKDLSIGIVAGISGVLVLSVRLIGEANHSGTTPMHLRADAFTGLAEVGAAIPTIISEIGTDQSRITIGKVELKPNFPHTIPGQADFTVIIRDTSAKAMANIRTRLEQTIKDVADGHRLSHEIAERSYLPPENLDESIRDLFVGEARQLSYSHQVMPSGAGHDAQTMQAFCPSGLVFVPSRAGISHSPQEWTDWAHIEKGAQLMLNAVHRLTTSME